MVPCALLAFISFSLNLLCMYVCMFVCKYIDTFALHILAHFPPYFYVPLSIYIKKGIPLCITFPYMYIVHSTLYARRNSWLPIYTCINFLLESEIEMGIIFRTKKFICVCPLSISRMRRNIEFMTVILRGKIETKRTKGFC